MDLEQEILWVRRLWAERYRHRLQPPQDQLQGVTESRLEQRERSRAVHHVNGERALAAPSLGKRQSREHDGRLENVRKSTSAVSGALRHYREQSAKRYQRERTERAALDPAARFPLLRLFAGSADARATAPWSAYPETRPIAITQSLNDGLWNQRCRSPRTQQLAQGASRGTTKQLGFGLRTALMMLQFRSKRFHLPAALSTDPFTLRATRYVQSLGNEVTCQALVTSRPAWSMEESAEVLAAHEASQVLENHPSDLCRMLHQEKQARGHVWCARASSLRDARGYHMLTIPAPRHVSYDFAPAGQYTSQGLFQRRTALVKNAFAELSAEAYLVCKRYQDLPDAAYRCRSAAQFAAWRQRRQEQRDRAETAMRLAQAQTPAIHSNENQYLWDTRLTLFMHGTRISQADRHAQILIDRYASS
jgi:hypothetical protein